MKRRTHHLDLLETRFPELSVERDSGGRSFCTKRGGEVFRVDGSGSRLTLPVPRRMIEDLFGGLPFPVEAKESSSVIRLDRVEEKNLLFDLIDALHEQGMEAPPKARPARRKTGLRGDASAAAQPRSRVLARALVIGLGLLVAAFLALSWSLAQKGVDQDRERSIETLLRR